MTELLTAAQMRAIEQVAIASGQVTGLELMERAGRGVVEAVFEEWPALRTTSHRAVVLCGPGNNGGDGFVVARLLKEWGWEVEVFLYGDPTKLPPDARVNYERWVGMGEVRPLIEADLPDTSEGLVAEWHAKEGCVIFDALFGTGLGRQVEPGLLNLLRCTDGEFKTSNPRAFYLVAVDVPTGLCADSGKCLGPSPDKWWDHNGFRANLTVTFHRAKLGHILADGTDHSGKVVVKDIGLKSSVGIEMPTIRGIDVSKSVHMHKFSYGHALILSGPPGQGGAARMTARGALRIGAGLVTLACPPDAIPENAMRLDAIMVRPWGEVEGLQVALDDDRINAICVGPGLGLDARGEAVLRVALGQCLGEPRPNIGRGSPRRAIVLDADALTLIARDPALFALLHENCVLTPHHGEFARLFPDIAAKLDAPATKGPAYSKVDATRDAAARANCTVLFKGPDTVIASPDGTCAINSAAYDRAAPWLATAGSGDVLAGFITGLLARGFAPQQASETAAWLHVECARSFGPGLIAEDLPGELPKVFLALGL